MLPRVAKVQAKDADYLLFCVDDFISRHLTYQGVWEELFLEISKEMLSNYENPLVIDVGAHIGAFSIPIAKAINARGGRVISFEPQRIIYMQLCANTILNRLENVYPHNIAICDFDQVVTIPELDYQTCVNASAFSMEKRYRERHGIEGSVKEDVYKVPGIALDSFEISGMVSLVKIDVEGLEFEVIKGAKKFLGRHEFPPILFEAWDFEWFEEERCRLIELVESMDYQITKLGQSEFLAQHPQHPQQFEFQFVDQHSLRLMRVR